MNMESAACRGASSLSLGRCLGQGRQRVLRVRLATLLAACSVGFVIRGHTLATSSHRRSHRHGEPVVKQQQQQRQQQQQQHEHEQQPLPQQLSGSNHREVILKQPQQQPQQQSALVPQANIPQLTMFARPAVMPSLDQVTLDCVKYSGPCFFMNHPTGDAPTQQVQAAAQRERQPVLRPTALPLRPFPLQPAQREPSARHAVLNGPADQRRKAAAARARSDAFLFSQPIGSIPQPRGVRLHGGWDGAGVGLRGGAR